MLFLGLARASSSAAMTAMYCKDLKVSLVNGSLTLWLLGATTDPSAEVSCNMILTETSFYFFRCVADVKAVGTKLFVPPYRFRFNIIKLPIKSINTGKNKKVFINFLLNGML